MRPSPNVDRGHCHHLSGHRISNRRRIAALLPPLVTALMLVPVPVVLMLVTALPLVVLVLVLVLVTALPLVVLVLVLVVATQVVT